MGERAQRQPVLVAVHQLGQRPEQVVAEPEVGVERQAQIELEIEAQVVVGGRFAVRGGGGGVVRARSGALGPCLGVQAQRGHLGVGGHTRNLGW